VFSFQIFLKSFIKRLPAQPNTAMSQPMTPISYAGAMKAGLPKSTAAVEHAAKPVEAFVFEKGTKMPNDVAFNIASLATAMVSMSGVTEKTAATHVRRNKDGALNTSPSIKKALATPGAGVRVAELAAGLVAGRFETFVDLKTIGYLVAASAIASEKPSITVVKPIVDALKAGGLENYIQFFTKLGLSMKDGTVPMGRQELALGYHYMEHLLSTSNQAFYDAQYPASQDMFKPARKSASPTKQSVAPKQAPPAAPTPKPVAPSVEQPSLGRIPTPVVASAAPVASIAQGPKQAPPAALPLKTVAPVGQPLVGQTLKDGVPVTQPANVPKISKEARQQALRVAGEVRKPAPSGMDTSSDKSVKRKAADAAPVAQMPKKVISASMDTASDKSTKAPRTGTFAICPRDSTPKMTLAQQAAMPAKRKATAAVTQPQAAPAAKKVKKVKKVDITPRDIANAAIRHGITLHEGFKTEVAQGPGHELAARGKLREVYAVVLKMVSDIGDTCIGQDSGDAKMLFLYNIAVSTSGAESQSPMSLHEFQLRVVGLVHTLATEKLKSYTLDVERYTKRQVTITSVKLLEYLDAATLSTPFAKMMKNAFLNKNSDMSVDSISVVIHADLSPTRFTRTAFDDVTKAFSGQHFETRIKNFLTTNTTIDADKKAYLYELLRAWKSVKVTKPLLRFGLKLTRQCMWLAGPGTVFASFLGPANHAVFYSAETCTTGLHSAHEISDAEVTLGKRTVSLKSAVTTSMAISTLIVELDGAVGRDEWLRAATQSKKTLSEMLGIHELVDMKEAYERYRMCFDEKVIDDLYIADSETAKQLFAVSVCQAGLAEDYVYLLRGEYLAECEEQRTDALAVIHKALTKVKSFLPDNNHASSYTSLLEWQSYESARLHLSACIPIVKDWVQMVFHRDDLTPELIGFVHSLPSARSAKNFALSHAKDLHVIEAEERAMDEQQDAIDRALSDDDNDSDEEDIVFVDDVVDVDDVDDDGDDEHEAPF
jgi:hypothetical protein